MIIDTQHQIYSIKLQKKAAAAIHTLILSLKHVPSRRRNYCHHKEETYRPSSLFFFCLIIDEPQQTFMQMMGQKKDGPDLEHQAILRIRGK